MISSCLLGALQLTAVVTRYMLPSERQRPANCQFICSVALIRRNNIRTPICQLNTAKIVTGMKHLSQQTIKVDWLAGWLAKYSPSSHSGAVLNGAPPLPFFFFRFKSQFCINLRLRHLFFFFFFLCW